MFVSYQARPTQHHYVRCKCEGVLEKLKGGIFLCWATNVGLPAGSKPGDEIMYVRHHLEANSDWIITRFRALMNLTLQWHTYEQAQGGDRNVWTDSKLLNRGTWSSLPFQVCSLHTQVQQLHWHELLVKGLWQLYSASDAQSLAFWQNARASAHENQECQRAHLELGRIRKDAGNRALFMNLLGCARCVRFLELVCCIISCVNGLTQRGLCRMSRTCF